MIKEDGSQRQDATPQRHADRHGAGVFVESHLWHYMVIRGRDEWLLTREHLSPLAVQVPDPAQVEKDFCRRVQSTRWLQNLSLLVYLTFIVAPPIIGKALSRPKWPWWLLITTALAPHLILAWKTRALRDEIAASLGGWRPLLSASDVVSTEGRAPFAGPGLPLSLSLCFFIFGLGLAAFVGFVEKCAGRTNLALLVVSLDIAWFLPALIWWHLRRGILEERIAAGVTAPFLPIKLHRLCIVFGFGLGTLGLWVAKCGPECWQSSSLCAGSGVRVEEQ